MRFVVFAALLLPSMAAAQDLGTRLGDPSRAWQAGPVEVAPSLQEAPAVQLEEGAIPDPELTDRLRALDATYGALSLASGPNWFNIVISLAMGAAELGFGIAFTQLATTPGTIEAALPGYFITLGTVAIARTIVVDIVLRPDPRGVALEYQHMPSITRANRLERLSYGERQLDALADYSFISRMVDAGLNITGAAASMIAYFAPRNFMLQPFSEFEAFIFIGPAISLIMAIVTLASPSEAEQRRDAYGRLRQTLHERRGQPVVEEGSYDEDAVPPPPSAGLSFTVGGGVDPRGGGFFSLGAAF